MLGLAVLEAAIASSAAVVPDPADSTTDPQAHRHRAFSALVEQAESVRGRLDRLAMDVPAWRMPMTSQAQERSMMRTNAIQDELDFEPSVISLPI